jgi:hypothetical protein
METAVSPAISDKESLDLVRWLIENYDERKASVAGRAAILLNADALLLAATTFLIDKLLSKTGQFNSSEKLVLLTCIALALLLLIASIAVATNGMANIWKASKEKFGAEVPKRVYYYPRQTFEEFRTLSDFADSFQIIDQRKLMEYSLGHLWVITTEYRDRYKYLRWSTRFLVLAIFPLVFSVAMVLYKSI